MPEKQSPVVLIGLGGTGKQSLLYLRRMFLDRYGVKTLPHIAMVVLDTDGTERNLDDSEYNEFDREAAFSADDKDSFVRIPLDETLANFRRNRDMYPHIDSWFDRALDSRSDITHGAGQIRAMGRFAFFTHYPRIRSAFHEAYQRVNSKAAKDDALEKFNIAIDPDTPVETWVVFSVAGGTGAGMFLDAAFLAKQEASLFPGSPGVRSIILLPTAFTNDLPQSPSSSAKYRPFANAYAALRELESYNYPQGADSSGKESGRFQVQWTIEQYRQRPRQTIDGPVFSNSYLVDSAPRDGGGQVSGDLMGLCNMIAEWLFVQYSSVAPELTEKLHSLRSNDNLVLTPLAGLLLSGDQPSDSDGRGHVQLFSRRYSGFGLSKIYVPTVNIAEQAYAKLVADMANMWLTDEKQGDVRKTIERSLYPNIHLPTDGSTRGFTEALGARLSMDGAKQPLKRRIDNLIEDKYRKLKARGFEPGAENEARDWFSHEVMTNLLDSNPAVARRGEITRIVDPDNTQAAFDEIAKALDQFLSATLARSGDRIGFADTALDLVLKDFQKAAEQAGKRIPAEKNRSDRLQSEADTLLRWASEARGFDRSTIFETAFAKMKDRAGAEFRRQVFEAIFKLANDAVAHVGVGRKVTNADGKEEIVQTGLKSGLEALRQTLKTLVNRANQRIVSLKALPSSSLNYRAPATVPQPGQTDQTTDLELIYKTADGKPLTGTALWELEARLYQSLGRTGFVSPWFLRDKNDAGSIEEVFREVLGFARRQLDYMPARMQDALGCFQKKIEGEKATGQFEAEVKRVMDRGSPWLPAPLHHLPPGNDNYRRIEETSYVTTSGQALKGARDALFKIVLKNGRNSLAGPLDTVYFESEVAGVPLCSVRYIDLYRNAYLGYLDSQDAGTRIVHTELDTEKYTDLVPLTVEENGLRQDAVRAFIQGVVRGVIQADARGGGLPEWRFLEDNDLHVQPFERRLGRYSTAIRLLSRQDRALYSALMQEIAKLDANRLTQDDVGYVFAALSKMDREPPITASDWKTAMRTVLDDMRAKYSPKVVDDARRAEATSATWRQAIANGSNPPFLVVKELTQQS